MERKWVMVAFGDILGFGVWRRRASTQPEISGPFLQRFYDEIQHFNKRNPNVYIKYLGDGIMILREIPENKHSKMQAPCFIQQAGILNARLLKTVRECPYPSPRGFRMRVTAGHVDKITIIDPLDSARKVPEYVGYAVNLAQRLLEISPDIPFICHESVIKIIGKNKFKTKLLNKINENPRGIDSEDIARLWMVEF